MVTSEEIRRKLEEKKRAKAAGSAPSSKTPPTAPKSDVSSDRMPNPKMPRPKAPPSRQEEPVVEAPPIREVEEPVPQAQEEELKHCPNCDVDYSNDTNFCPDCGSKLEDVVVEEVPAEEIPVNEENLEETQDYEEETPQQYNEETPQDYEPIEETTLEDIPLNTATFADDIVVVTSNFVPGFKAVETLGFVYGLTVRSRGVGGQIGAGIRSMFGGEIKEYVKMMEESRNQALERMIEHARSMGANAIISSRFDSDQISDIMQEILAYGTAVIIEEEDSQ